MKSAKLLDELEQKLAERKILKDFLYRLSNGVRIARKKYNDLKATVDCDIDYAILIDAKLNELIKELHELAD